MTPSDDEIRAACGTLLTEYDWATMSIDAIRLRLYRAAYAAGMEAAAKVREERAEAWDVNSDRESGEQHGVAYAATIVRELKGQACRCAFCLRI